MKIVLDVATILGGIAAVIFFWDRFSALRYRVIQRVANQQLPPTPQLTLSSLEKHQIPTIIFCSIGGVIIGIVGGNFGYEGMILSAFLWLIPGLVGGKFDDWKLYEDFSTMLLFGGGVIFFWGELLGLFCLAIEAISGVHVSGFTAGIILSVIGAIVGAISGERATNYNS
jgi:uncharacterized membrane protein